jgi:hypothetical protein
MARLDPEEFLDQEVTRVYIAGNVGEANRVEETLTKRGFDYIVEIEPYLRRILGIFPSKVAGAGFYVLSDQGPPARAALRAAGLVAGLEDDEAD